MAKYIKYMTTLNDGELEFTTLRDEERPIIHEDDEAYYIDISEIDSEPYGYPKKYEWVHYIVREED